MAALTFPLDLILRGVFWRRSFRLQYRQEVSRVANGGSIRKDFGRPLWMAEYQSKVMSANEISAMRARLDSMDGGIQTFRGLDPARCRPIAYPAKRGFPVGTTGSGTLSQIFSDNKRVALSGMGPGFVVTAGDMMQIGTGDLYSVVQGGTSNAQGTISEIELRPFIWPGTTTGTAVTFIKPSCIMAVAPETITEDVSALTGRGTYTFQAWEVRSA